MIPKIIHYCWLSNDPIPEKLKKCMKSWKKKLPDYEIIKWDFNCFEKESSLWVKQAFENKKYAFAADYIRLFAIYHYGGIYLDSDVEVLKSFNPFLDSDHMVGWEVKNYGIEAAVIGAEKGAKWVEECLKYYSNRPFIKDDGTFDTRTLPTILFERLNVCGYIQSSNLDAKESAYSWKIYPKEYFSPKSYKDGVIYKTKNTVTIHHFAGSWLPWDGKLRNRFLWLANNYPRLYYYCIYLPIYELHKYGIIGNS